MCDPRDSAPHYLFRGDAPRIAAYPRCRQISGAQSPQAFPVQATHAAQCAHRTQQYRRSLNRLNHECCILSPVYLYAYKFSERKGEKEEGKKGEKSALFSNPPSSFAGRTRTRSMLGSSNNQLISVLSGDNQLPDSVCTVSLSISVAIYTFLALRTDRHTN
jgi:hypothetical protein